MFFYKYPVAANGGSAWNERGSVAAKDFDATDFTDDNTYRDLDLSGIVGAAAVLVLLRVRIDTPDVGAHFYLRTKGYAGFYNQGSLLSQVANKAISKDVWVYTDANGYIQYNATASAWTALEINVGGWFS